MSRLPLTATRHTALTSPPVGTQIRLPLKSDEVPTNIVLGALPDFFGAFAIEAQFEYSLSLDSHPSGSFSFRIEAKKKEILKEILRENTELTAFGVGFAVESVSFTEIPAAQEPLRVILVSVNLRGKWQFYAEKLASLQKSRAIAAGEKDPDCQQQEDAGSVKKLAYLTCQELAARVGAAFTAPGRWWIRIPRGTLPSEGITLGGALEERKGINRCFLEWNDPNEIRGRRFDETRQWRIEEKDIWSEVTSTMSGAYPCPQQLQPPSDRFYPDVSDEPLPAFPQSPRTLQIQKEKPWPLAKRYWPRYRLDGQFVQEAKAEKLQKERRKEESARWKQKPWQEYALESGDLDPTKPLDPNGFITTVAVTHSDKKVIRRTFYRNSTPVKVEEKIYAIEIYGDQLYYYHLGDNEWRTYSTPAEAYWTLIEETITVNEYESRYGFYVGKTTTGRTRVRFRDESGSPPETAIIFMLNTGTIMEDLLDSDPNKLSNLIGSVFQEIQGGDVLQTATEFPDSGFLSQALYQIDPLYRFQWLPICRQECRILEPKSKYFPNTGEGESTGQKKCLPNGQAAYKQEENPNYAPPYFPKKTINVSSGHLTYPNPEWQLQDEVWTRLDRNIYDPGGEWQPKTPIAPLLETGKLTVEEQSIEILPANSSIRSHYEVNTSRTETEDIYTTYTRRYEAKGAGYNLALQEASFSESIGQPPDAERLAREWEQISADESEKAKEPSDFVWYVKSPVDDCAKNSFIERAGYIPVAATASYSRELEGGSLSFSTAETLQEAKNAAWFSLFLENIRGMGTEEFSVQFNPNYRPGDRVTRVLNGWQGERIIISVRHSLAIEGLYENRPVVTGITRLTLAPIPDIQLEYKKERVPENEDRDRENPRDRQIGNLGTIECKLSELYTRYSK